MIRPARSCTTENRHIADLALAPEIQPAGIARPMIHRHSEVKATSNPYFGLGGTSY